MKFDVLLADGETQCGNLDEADQDVHSLCGVSVGGLTKFGLDKFGDYSWQVMYEYNFGAHIKLESTEDIEKMAKTFIHLSVVNNTAGHRLWGDYTPHPIEVYFSLREIISSWFCPHITATILSS